MGHRSSDRRSGARVRAAGFAVRVVAVTLGIGLFSHIVRLTIEGRGAEAPLLSVLSETLLILPLAAVVLLLADRAAGDAFRWLRHGAKGSASDHRTARWVGGLAGAAAWATVSIQLTAIGSWLTPDAQRAALDPVRLAADATVAALVAMAVLTPFVRSTRTRPAGRHGRSPARRPRSLTRAAAVTVSTAVVATSQLVPAVQAAEATETAPAETTAACSPASADREYDVAAISVAIPYNRFGDVDPHGMVYVLEQDRAAMENWARPLADDPAADPARNRRLRPRPLVLRANEGECVSVTFTNRLDPTALAGAVTDPRASLHVSGVAYDAGTSDGGAVGYNEDTTVGIGQTLTYSWRAPSAEGLFLFKDQGMPAGGEADGGSASHGLWGGLAVEPAGSTWSDPRTGLPLYPVSNVAEVSGELYLDAQITPPSGNAFRETVQISQDEIPGIGFGFNYGADAQHNRDRKRCPDCVGEETSLSSWTYGDPALVKLASGGDTPGGQGWPVTAGTDPEDCQSDDGRERPALLMPVVDGKRVPASCWTANVTHGYVGDPTKIRFGHAGVKETHVFHMHAHQWLSEPRAVGTAGTNPTTPDDGTRRPAGTTIDSQTYAPGETFTADLLFGAGSKNGTVGDAIFHCHLYPHFAEGFWSLFRTHDVTEDGRGTTPDGIRVPPLLELPDRGSTTPAPTADNPGFPRFIPGRYGWRAPQPPNSVSDADGSAATRIVAGQGLDPALLNRVQEISTKGGAGTFALGYRGQQTGGIANDASAAAVEEALEALSTITAVGVSGAGTSADPWVVTFEDPDRNVRELTSSDPVTITTRADDLTKALALERTVQARGYPDAEPRPGAPLGDPCPTGAREVTYDVTVLQTDITYNEAGWHDTQGRMLVRTADVPAIDAGTMQPEPMFIRVNAGDCVNFNLTNRLPNWYGNDAFQVLQQTNMVGEHIHLVKFDVTGSDGSSNGWNYQQAAFSKAQSDFNADVIDGRRECTTDEGEGACRLPLPAADGYSPTGVHRGEGQTIHERWYADYELRTVFTHDHHFPAVDQGRGLFGALIVEPKGMDFRHGLTGRYQQPINDPAHGTPCGSSCEGTAAGATFDVIGPGSSDDFREFGLAFQDFVPLTKAGGDPKKREDVLNPPAAPETFAKNDPGVMGVNYRNAPFVLREMVDGVRTDPAHVFSSTLHGDPATPVLKAYAGDPVRVRLIAASQEEQHNFALHGMRWRDDPDNPKSALVGSKTLGVSEAFNVELPEMDCGLDTDCRGDYLYTSAGTDDVYLGMWGLMRVFGKGVKELRPLPDNTPQAVNGDTNAPVTGEAPPPANKPGTVCPTGAPVTEFRVAATDARITYNAAGDHDPYGLVHVAAEPGETIAEAVARARKNPEPLAIRANEGDCVEVTLYNRIDPDGAFAKEHGPRGAADGDPSLPLEPSSGTPAGLRVSLHPQLLEYDVRGSDGATVGFNKDQTVGPGEDIRYRWFADDVSPGEAGAVNLTDYGDVRGHRHHGLSGSLTIEPKGATYHDPMTGEPITSGVVADIRVPGREDFREYTLAVQDGLNLRDAQGRIIPDAADHPPAPGEQADPLDAEDQGEKGFGYASEPFRHRLGLDPVEANAANPLDGSALASVFSSRVHGDPATPVFRAYAGDPVRLRVVQGGDKPRQNSIDVAGHSWLRQPGDPDSDRIGTQGGMTVNRSMNLDLGAAGGGTPGDYLYGNRVAFNHLSGGMWGILRAYRPATDAGLWEPDRLAEGSTSLTEGDNPQRADYHPLQPLERTSLSVEVFDDADGNGTRGSGEAAAKGATLTLTPADASSPALRRTVDTSGSAHFSVGRGAYDLTLDPPDGWASTSPRTVRVDLTAENALADVSFGLVELGEAGVRLFHDADGDGAAGADEAALEGWPVTLTKGSDVRRATTGTDGVAVFSGLEPGEWSARSSEAGWLATRELPVTVTVAGGAKRSAATDTRLGFTRRAGLSVKIFNDADDDATQDEGESSRAGWKVTAVGGPPERQVTVTATTDADGVATFVDPDPSITGLRPGAWTITPTLPRDWSLRGGEATTTTTTSSPTPGFSCGQSACRTTLVSETTQLATLRVGNPFVRVIATPFVDADADGVRQGSEKKLVGWTATAYPVAADGSLGAGELLETGTDGRADFYPLAGTTYEIEMISPEPSTDPTVPRWTSTNRTGCTDHGTDQRRCVTRLTVLPGETGTASFGFVQRGVVSVRVFHDYDRDAEADDHEPPLAHRTVTLWSANGRTSLGTAVTDSSGMASFSATAGTKYQVSTTLPTGWVRTAPLDARGTVLAKVPVTGPSSSTQTEVTFGQYNSRDSVPPPVPVANSAGGSFTQPQTVTLRSETGATIRYTLDGSMPSATHGMRYSSGVVIGGDRVLRAVAIDPAGNVSAELAPEDPTLPPGLDFTVAVPGATVGSATPTRWTATKGGTPSGDPTVTLAAEDGLRLLLPSALISKSAGHGVDGYATVRLPSGQRDLATLGVVVDSRVNLPGAKGALWVHDWRAGSWTRLLPDDTIDTADLRSVVYVGGDPRRFVGPDGDVRVRLAATRTAGAFDTRVDQVVLRYSYR